MGEDGSITRRRDKFQFNRVGEKFSSERVDLDSEDLG